ncbi:fibrinogen-like protein 1 [Glandiceps talaboti]
MLRQGDSRRCVFRFNVLEEEFSSCHSLEMEKRLDKLTEEVHEMRLTLAGLRYNNREKDLKNLRDCQDVRNAGAVAKGEYVIWPVISPYSMRVYCEMDDNKGWTVIQRRLDGSVDFDRFWQDYRDGFGDLSGEHWLGNDNIYYLSSGNQRPYELRIEVTDWNGNTANAVYSDFKIDGPTNKFKLSLGEFMGGNAGDSMLYGERFKIHNGQFFSTKDVDNDNDGHTISCAKTYNSGWWFDSCFISNLNGRYQKSSQPIEQWQGILWNSLNGHYSYKSSVMKIRPLEYGKD